MGELPTLCVQALLRMRPESKQQDLNEVMAIGGVILHCYNDNKAVGGVQMELNRALQSKMPWTGFLSTHPTHIGDCAAITGAVSMRYHMYGP